MLNLVEHDLRAGANSVRTAFSSIGDRVLLALMLAVACFFTADFLRGFSGTQLRLSLPGLLACFALTAFLVHAFCQHRLRHFVEHSALAFFALSARPRLAYRAFWLGSALLLDCLVVAALYASAGGNEVAESLRRALAFGWLAGLAGAAAGWLWQCAGRRLRGALRSLRTGRSQRGQMPETLPHGRLACLLAVTVRRQSPLGRTIMAALLWVGGAGLSIGLVGLGLRRLLSPGESLAALALLLALGLIVLSRLGAGRIKCLGFLGFGPLAPGLMPVLAMAVLVAPAGLALPFIAPATALPAAGALLAPLFLFGLVAYLRSLHYRLKTRSRADLAIQLDGACIAVLGVLFAPAALLFIVVRVYRLHRAARAATWSLP